MLINRVGRPSSETMATEGEECELQQLVPSDDDSRMMSKSGEVTPPVTAGVSKVTQTSPTSPDSNKVSSSAGSVRGAQSQGSGGSRNPNRMSAAPILGTSAITSPAGSVTGSQHTKFLYVNERLPCASSLMLDNSPSSREPRLNPVAARLHKTKKGIDMGAGRRSCQHHSFLSDVTDVRRMEAALLHLLEDFHSGKLRAFGKDCSMEQMTGIREQQERLARLHFDLGAQQELYDPLSDEGLHAGQENMHRLMESLEQLSVSIERLHSFSSDSRDSSLLQD
ncbi:coiled-coil domain-containing protein 28A isoform X2 [Zootermopsis nevadensis]|uniref:Coiled-coil domain-containing protein 28B n=1 Tax=Zootermopsis nevadensis TaxID=136037 RepID=A0A067QKX7_ZOONE|nr:coiled-coil domain-containing protein 28A isoform X2 [Zootermopsis nevadensis]KDR09859.1 Coiled-coil domain-containing protein 28B [Zootermopsis nevadensis]